MLQPGGVAGDETTSLLASKMSDYGGAAPSVTESVLEAVEPVTLGWHGVRVRVQKSGRQLLDSISGLARPGELLALMGASGAGKTTLLNTLLRRNLRGLEVDGRVTVNGHEIGRQITQLSGYAQQDELFMGTLTVREHLEIQARLRLPRATAAKKKRRVDAVLVQLGLWKCQRTTIGIQGIRKGISGGEARRLTFACELLSNPPILFCDEPTTGLDSFMAESVVQVLSRLAHSGRTVVCTIHQPASQLYAMFDSVLFLAAGRTAFLGTPARSIEYFAECGHPCPDAYNPADLIIETLAIQAANELECRQRVQAICDSFEKSVEGQQVLEHLDREAKELRPLPQSRRSASFVVQFLALLWRALLDNWRNPSLARAKVIQKTVMGLFIGLLYFQTQLDLTGISNLNGALFYIVSELTYSTLFGILTFLPNDYPLLVREYHDGLYSVPAYYLSRALSYVPLFTADGLIMLLVCYWMVGFASTIMKVLNACLIAFLIEQSSSAFGVMLSTCAPSYPIAVSLAGPLLTLLSLTGGLYANVGALPAYIAWIQYLSWFRYGFEAFTINQWDGVGLTADAQTNQTAVLASDAIRDEILASYSFSASNFTQDIVLMSGFVLVFYGIGLVGLTIRVRRSR